MNYDRNEISSISLNKDSVYESQTVVQAAIDDLKHNTEIAISNEKIIKGDIIHGIYEVLDDAILGGMGSVWRVHHNSWSIELAMKRPQPRFFAEGSMTRKADFISECENWIKLGLHPNIVSCYYVRDIGGVPTIFSEWMDNGSLKDRIHDGSLYVGTEEDINKRIIDIAIQSLRGIAYAHNMDLVHQDIKPANILLSKNWDAKIADFGLAKARETFNDGEDARASGYTLEYCPAEQMRGETPAAWMDIYSWATSVLEMYLRKRAWSKGADVIEVVKSFEGKTESAIPCDILRLFEDCFCGRASNADEVIAKLETIYTTEFGCEYSRPEIHNEYQTAAALNNTALSFLDLNKDEMAEECWEKAMYVDRRNADVNYNYALFLWRKGLITSEEAVERMSNISVVKEREHFASKLRKERDGYIEIKHSGEEIDRNNNTTDRTKEAKEVFADCEQYTSGEYVDIEYQTNADHTAAWMVLNKYILFIKNLSTGRTVGPLYPKNYGQEHFIYPAFYNGGKYVGCVGSNKSGEYLNVWEASTGRYIEAVTFTQKFEDLMDFVKHGADYYLGERSDYSVSRIENIQERVLAETKFNEYLESAEEAYNNGNLAKAFEKLEEATKLSGFSITPQIVYMRQKFGAKLDSLGVRHIVLTDELVADDVIIEDEIARVCSEEKRYTKDGAYGICIDHGRILMYSNSSLLYHEAYGQDIMSADFISQDRRIVYGDKEGYIRLIDTEKFAGITASGWWLLEDKLFLPCDNIEDNGLVFALDDKSFAVKQNDGYHKCLIDELYSYDEEVLLNERQTKSRMVLETEGLLTAKAGDTVFFGKQEQNLRKKEPIPWIVLEHNNDEIVLLSKYCIDVFGGKNSLAFSLNTQSRRYLNKVFLENAFDEDERRLIANNEVRHISDEQLDKYLPETADRLCMPSPAALNKRVKRKEGYVRWLTEKSIIDFDGNYFPYGFDDWVNDLGLRPLIKIDLKIPVI